MHAYDLQHSIILWHLEGISCHGNQHTTWCDFRNMHLFGISGEAFDVTLDIDKLSFPTIQFKSSPIKICPFHLQLKWAIISLQDTSITCRGNTIMDEDYDSSYHLRPCFSHKCSSDKGHQQCWPSSVPVL